MSEQKKYAVITFLFNKYDLLREPLIVDEKADYYCITDDKDLKSENWTIIYVNEFDTDKLTGVQKTYMAKYSFYKYIPTNYKYYFTIDASLKILDKLSPIIQYADSNKFDIGLSMHPKRSKWSDEYDEWINVRGLDEKYKQIFMNYAAKNGFDYTTETGLIECTVKLYRNNKKIINFIDDVYKTLLETNNFEDKNDQCYFTLVFHAHHNKLKSFFFYQELYSDSRYFNSYHHNTDVQWITQKNKNTNTHTLFGKEIDLFETEKKCCVAFITQKEKLEKYEEQSLKQCIKIFGKKRDIKLIVPQKISVEYYNEYTDKLEIYKVNDKWLESISSYNSMCCNNEFWKIFSKYNYVLIYQTDCWVFEDKLDDFIKLGYDYYGAPWPFFNNDVGNGGLSLRKVKKMLDITSKYEYTDTKINEDIWFTRNHKDELNKCPWEDAVNFSLERASTTLLKEIKTIPMGFHGKDIIKLWDDDGKKFLEFKNKYVNGLDNLDLYICAHKEFKSAVKSKAYKIVWANKINNDTAENGLKGSFYSELMSYKYINDNLKLKKYIGFCSYRKYFNFLDDIPDMDEIFSSYDAIVAKPLEFKQTVKQQYNLLHNIEDLYIVGGIIADKYPSYCQTWHNFINGKILIPYNMFIMKSEDFKEYINFIFSILDEYLEIVGTDINKRIYDNYEKYIKNFYPNNTVEYQYRIGGYTAERLTNLFIMAHFKKLKTYPVIITEDKYTKKDNP